MDLGSAASLILAVVPLKQITIYFGDGAETSQFTGPYRTLQGTRKHLPKIKSYQSFFERAGILLTALGER
jgi:hypothetical protein